LKINGEQIKIFGVSAFLIYEILKYTLILSRVLEEISNVINPMFVTNSMTNVQFVPIFISHCYVIIRLNAKQR